MRLMRLMPLDQKHDTSRPPKGKTIYPYLLGGLRVERLNQMWCADITYLPAIMDWHTRKVLAGRISNTQEADVCVNALSEAIHRFCAPNIMNTDSHSSLPSPGPTG